MTLAQPASCSFLYDLRVIAKITGGDALSIRCGSAEVSYGGTMSDLRDVVIIGPGRGPLQHHLGCGIQTTGHRRGTDSGGQLVNTTEVENF